ncbi:hypothetical protein Rctr197k_104 [Virus Rctr197k]|nr:hypothetical protein Rctr197k_104 [Virus Rctr197k]
MRYETVGTIREQVAEALKRKKEARKQAFDPAELESTVYQRWIENRIEDARRNRRLITAQQHQDLMARRELRLDDRARYVGPPRLERSPASGKQILRPHGQTGSIAQVQRGLGGRPIWTFMPDVPKKTLDAAEVMDIEVMQLTTAEWTDLERIV